MNGPLVDPMDVSAKGFLKDYLKQLGGAHLDTGNTNTYVRGLDHAYVVGTVTDSQKDGFLVLLDQLDHQCLLQRGNSA